RELEARTHHPCAFREQTHSFGRRCFVLLGRKRERRDLPYLFALNSETFAAGREYRQRRTAVEQPANDLGAGVEHVFTVIEDQERPAVAEELQQEVLGVGR